MSELNDFVEVVISRETQAIAVSSFGTLAIVSEFATSKTTTTFDRYREYSSLTEMTDDGWLTTDKEYLAATIIFSQSPKVDKILIGRIDPDDATLTAGLNAIQAAVADWYCWIYIATATGKIVFDADLVTSNEIDIVVNGTAVTTVTFNTDHDTTMDDIVTQIEADITNSSVTLDATDVNNRTLLVEVFGGVSTLTAAVTLGASQAGATITYIVEDDFKACAAWNETQKKILFVASSQAGIYDPSSTDDIAYFLKSLAYDRTVCLYHTAAQENTTPSWIEAGFPGEALPYDPGSQTWAFKTIAGVAPYGLTSGERTAVLAKNCNIYTTTAGVNITEAGKVASGEYIDIIRGLDWLEAKLQEAVFTNLINVRKIPMTDEGIALIENTIKGVLYEGARAGLLIESSIEVTVPLAADISTADKLARALTGIEFTAILQGAIHSVSISGTVTV